MTEAISRTELFQRVDDAFQARFPHAPRSLSGASKAEWRQWWVAERDRQLDEEVSRVYWTRWPDAPIELDDTSPEWDKWRIIQRKVRDEVLANAPEPEDVDYQNAGDLTGMVSPASVRSEDVLAVAS